MMVFSIAGDLRILAATVDDNAALDGDVVVAKHMHFPCAASEASTRIVDSLLFRLVHHVFKFHILRVGFL